MFNVIIKTAIIYFFVMLAVRLMGKRQASQLQPFDLIIAIMIAEVASTPMDGTGTPITFGLVPIITLLVLHNVIAMVSMKSERVRAFFTGRPSIVIHKGILRQKELKKLDYNLNDLIEQLRAKDVIDIRDVYFAVLETNGELSVMLHPEKRAVQPCDMQLVPPNNGFCYDIILDGKIKPRNLQKLGFSEKALESLLRKTKMKRARQVLIATSDETGSVFLQDYHGNQEAGTLGHG